MNNTNNRLPYVYIIEEINTGRKYIGSKFGKDADPNNFMIHDGYTTSSTTINIKILKNGLYSFKILDIISEEELQIPFNDYRTVLGYESWFQSYYNCAADPLWINSRNNNMKNFNYPFLDPIIKEKHKEIMNSDRVKLKTANTCIIRYNFSSYTKTLVSKNNMSNFWKNNKNGHSPYELCDKEKHKEIMNSEKVWDHIWKVWGEKYGCHPQQTSEVRAKTINTNILRYGVDNYFKTQEFKDRFYGENSPLKLPENRLKCSIAAKNPLVTIKRNKTIAEQDDITCPICGISGKRKSMKRYHFDRCGTVESRKRIKIKVFDINGNSQYINTVDYTNQEINFGKDRKTWPLLSSIIYKRLIKD